MHKALVTGGSRGIGAEIVLGLKKAGVEVISPARTELDLSSAVSVESYLRLHGGEGIDILVNDAGVNVLEPLEGITDKNWQTTLQVNLTAPMQLIRGFAGGMKQKKWGRVVNVSSIFSLVTKERRAAYSVSKAALNALTRSAALELAPCGILVNAVCPGFVDTEMTRANNSPEDLKRIASQVPLGRLAKPDEIAKTVVFLCSEENVYLTGQTLVVDGGYTCR
jgi:3-oxoacyl-[acyl-carrier protein] reductase